MAPMRAAVAALATGLVLVASGCGSAGAPSSAKLTQDAAALVPPDAIAFLSVDGNLGSQQWRRLDDLTRGIPLRTQVLDRVQKALRAAQLDFAQDVRPAIGDELGVAILRAEQGKPEAIVLTQPKDESKLRSLVAAYDRHAQGYRVERVGNWSVVADSPQTFQRVRQAESGQSLADQQWFKDASASVAGDALARVYASGKALSALPGRVGALVRAAGSSRWVAARLAVEQDAVRVDVHAAALNPVPILYRPTLLRDVPSGAVLAVSFKDLDRPFGLRWLERFLGPLARLKKGLQGEGAFYVLPGALLPIFALEIESPNPRNAVHAFRVLATRLRTRTGNALPVRVALYSSRVVLTDAPATLRTGGGSLLDDQTYKDAVAAAGVPDNVSFLAYADVARLAPIIQAVTALAGSGTSAPPQQLTLDRFGTLVAFGAREGSTSRFVLRVRFR